MQARSLTGDMRKAESTLSGCSAAYCATSTAPMEVPYARGARLRSGNAFPQAPRQRVASHFVPVVGPLWAQVCAPAGGRACRQGWLRAQP